MRYAFAVWLMMFGLLLVGAAGCKKDAATGNTNANNPGASGKVKDDAGGLSKPGKPNPPPP
jgi:hypothetical protein